MKNGTPGMGKSHMLYILTKPKWVPMWLHRLQEKRAWLRWNKGNYAMPSLNKHIISKKETEQ